MINALLRMLAITAGCLLVTPAIAQEQRAFLPGAATVSLAISGTTGRVQASTSDSNLPHIRIYNSGTVAVFIQCGDATVTAVLTTSMPIAPGSVEIISCPNLYVAGISAGTASLIYVTAGNGL